MNCVIKIKPINIGIYTNHTGKKNPPEPKPSRGGGALGAGVKSYILKIFTICQVYFYFFLNILKFSNNFGSFLAKICYFN